MLYNLFTMVSVEWKAFSLFVVGCISMYLLLVTITRLVLLVGAPDEQKALMVRELSWTAVPASMWFGLLITLLYKF